MLGWVFETAKAAYFQRGHLEINPGNSQFFFCRFQSGSCHKRDHFSEDGEPLILSLAAMVTNVDLGDNDGETKKAEGMKEMNVMDGAATFHRILFHQFAPCHEADPSRHHRHRLQIGWIGRLGPVAEQSSQVIERIAQCAHIPIEDGDQLSWIGRIEHEVI
jgi:hypothetical protein